MTHTSFLVGTEIKMKIWGIELTGKNEHVNAVISQHFKIYRTDLLRFVLQ